MTDIIAVIAEHADGGVNPVTFELIAFAKKLPEAESLPIQVLILGADIQNPAREIAKASGLDVVGYEIPAMPVYNGELYNQILVRHFSGAPPRYVCIAHTSSGADFAPALAIELNGACIGGIEDLLISEEGGCFARPVYGGKAIAHIRPPAVTSILTIQPGIFKSDPPSDQEPGTVDIRSASPTPRWWHSNGVKQMAVDTQGIAEAEIVVAAGQGIGEQENLDLIDQLASIFSKSAIAGSRIVCDLDWLAYGCQVGVTGATVSPRLYLACGISGAIQHVTGMRGSEFIVAINKDPSAAIFQVADICVVEDLTTFIPTLIETYRQTRD
ncbi:Electron transfer flavoprotein, alpha subunit [Olavius algarvensis Delta 1 endosymbiont]|nr:Electron transfer flavoprotein, alpha subunit [Olavius algarvensis Delta 1 endosymbiont]